MPAKVDKGNIIIYSFHKRRHSEAYASPLRQRGSVIRKGEYIGSGFIIRILA